MKQADGSQPQPAWPGFAEARRLSTTEESEKVMRVDTCKTDMLQSLGMTTLRSALALNLLWIGKLKFEEYEVENIAPLVTSSPLFAPVLKRIDQRQLAQLIGTTEIAMGTMIAGKRISSRASILGGLGAIGMFATTLSFLATTPGVWQEGKGAPKLSMVGQFLLKDGVFLGASLLVTADSLRSVRRG